MGGFDVSWPGAGGEELVESGIADHLEDGLAALAVTKH